MTCLLCSTVFSSARVLLLFSLVLLCFDVVVAGRSGAAVSQAVFVCVRGRDPIRWRDKQTDRRTAERQQQGHTSRFIQPIRQIDNHPADPIRAATTAGERHADAELRFVRDSEQQQRQQSPLTGIDPANPNTSNSTQQRCNKQLTTLVEARATSVTVESRQRRRTATAVTERRLLRHRSVIVP